MCCKTNDVEYIDKYVVPDITFPIFPTLEYAERNDNETVTVPAEWLVRLAEYKIRIDETKQTYTDFAALYRDSETSSE